MRSRFFVLLALFCAHSPLIERDVIIKRTDSGQLSYACVALGYRDPTAVEIATDSRILEDFLKDGSEDLLKGYSVFSSAKIDLVSGRIKRVNNKLSVIFQTTFKHGKAADSENIKSQPRVLAERVFVENLKTLPYKAQVI